MKPVRTFDLIVIGTGSAGATAAHQCRAAGWKVAIVDSQPFGGTCALRGCDPKKVLVGAAELMDWYRRMEGKGITGRAVRIDWPALLRFKQTFTDPVPKNREEGYAKAGIVALQGRAQFVDRNVLRVGDEILDATHVLIAAGAKPAPVGVPGEEHLTTSTDFLELDVLPKRALFVGGGYISFEFAHVAVRAGASVRILHKDDHPLAAFDQDLAALLVGATRDLGVDVQLNAPVEKIEKRGSTLVVHARTGDRRETFDADLVVHGAGRVPDIDDLELERANVQRERGGVVVNEYLQSVSNPAVYAAGDAAASGGPPLTPVAALEGHVAAMNLLNGNQLPVPDYTNVASVVFTVPPLASVGLQEATAKERGLKFLVKHEDTSWWYSTRRVNLPVSGYKTLVEEGSGRILGAHLFGPHADEVINLFALAMHAGISAGKLRGIPWGYPTSSSDIPYMM
ncbi:MAG: glutathione reductase (NADPH) [Parcubacteria group bacterium Gr01-1014_38]|nr:MAG: glutathione reductase (NADPH) [Parcubacteria group bacterium Gr01-1014_38]